MTLKTIINEQKCRTGEIGGMTADGRFWLPVVPVLLKSTGNGWDAPEIEFQLELRHFENDKITATVVESGADNRNSLRWEREYPLPALLKCSTVQDVCVELKKGIKTMEGWCKYSSQPAELIKECHSEGGFKNLSFSLAKLGLLASRPGPDEIAVCPNAE